MSELANFLNNTMYASKGMQRTRIPNVQCIDGVHVYALLNYRHWSGRNHYQTEHEYSLLVHRGNRGECKLFCKYLPCNAAPSVATLDTLIPEIGAVLHRLVYDPLNNELLETTNKIPPCPWGNDFLGSKYEDCSVCHRKTCATTDCNHPLCAQCETRLSSKPPHLCPICRHSLCLDSVEPREPREETSARRRRPAASNSRALDR